VELHQPSDSICICTNESWGGSETVNEYSISCTRRIILVRYLLLDRSIDTILPTHTHGVLGTPCRLETVTSLYTSTWTPAA